jgi:hypothetical protein
MNANAIFQFNSSPQKAAFLAEQEQDGISQTAGASAIEASRNFVCMRKLTI